MVTKPNISKSKVARFTLGTALVLLFAGLLIASTLTRKSGLVKDIKISTLNQQTSFVPRAEVEEIISASGSGAIHNTQLKDLDLEKIEAALESNPWIQNAEVFVDNKQNLQLELYERLPVARIFSNNGKSYYIDTSGRLLPDDVSIPMLVPVFTNVPYLSNDEMSIKIGKSIAHLGCVISNDSFWNAQITQINVLPNGNFEMATMIGNHKVIFGDSTRAKDKLHNLFVFYDKGLSKLGWDRYNIIDVRFKGQVVTSPGIDYVAPIVSDTAIDLPDDDRNIQSVTQQKPAEKPVVDQKSNSNTSNVAPVEKPKEKPIKKEEPKTKSKSTTDKKKVVDKQDKKRPSTNNQSTKQVDKTKKEKPKEKSKYLLPKKKLSRNEPYK